MITNDLQIARLTGRAGLVPRNDGIMDFLDSLF